MCGIIGFNWINEKNMKKAANLISHRGPDAEGYFLDKRYKVSMAHKRLSIIDLSDSANQPMSFLGYTIIFNGEIYNYEEIRNQLKKEYKFLTKSDTEVIIYAYDKWGSKCLDKFKGMFSFLIYDKKKQIFFIARDRFGIKPLYYFREETKKEGIKKEEKIAFASEIKPLILLNKKEKQEVDEKGLKQFFSFRFTLGETTMFKDIKKFLPGHYMIYDLRNKKIKSYHKYYELKKQKIEDKDISIYEKELRELMKDSVQRRMVADVPVSSFLSGGIDSTIITALAKKANPELNTFSVGFETTNELNYARFAAKEIGTNHHEFKMTKKDVTNYLKKMVYHMDEPIGDPGFLPIFFLSEQVKKHNKVVLSGDGGDEVLCGYDRYKLFHYGRTLRNFALFDFGNPILKRLKNMRGKNDYKAFFEVIRLFEKDELNKLGIEEYSAKNEWENKYKQPLLNAQEFDIKTLLPNDFFLKADKMSSAFGLEQRVPFLDHKLVEFAFSIPLKYKLKGWNEKHILKTSFEGIVPKEIIKRRKHGFNVPIDYWFQNILAEKLKELIEKNNHELYNKDYVYEMLKDIKKQKKGKNYKQNYILAQKLWSILMFEMWYDMFIKK